ncbi:PH domain-containing protein [bacterium]|nr:PH domain-containing protein [bacterium]
MKILNPFRGGGRELDIGDLAEVLEFMLIPGESVRRAYRLGEQVIVFTDKRLLTAPFRGATKKRTEFRSIPYRSILDFEKTTAGRGDIILTLRIAGTREHLQLHFSDDMMAVDCYRELSKQVLR